MKSLILYFFLLILRILFDFSLDAIYKYNRFSKILLKKIFKFVLGKRVSLILFLLYFILLSLKVYFVLKKKSYKNNAFRFFGTSYLNIVLVLLIKIVIFYIQVFIVEVEVSAFKWSIIRYNAYFKLAILLILDK